MQTIQDLFELSPDAIDYRLSCLKANQLEILKHLARGKNDQEVSEILRVKRGVVGYQIYLACERVGAPNRAVLIAMYSIWEYQRMCIRFRLGLVNPSTLQELYSVGAL